MSDFLTRLVQRQWGELPIVQPRILPSLSLSEPGVAENAASAREEIAREREASPRKRGREASGLSDSPAAQADADRWASDRLMSRERIEHTGDAQAAERSSAVGVNGANVTVQDLAEEQADLAGHLRLLRSLARQPEAHLESPTHDGVRPADHPLLQFQQHTTASLTPFSDGTAQPANQIRPRSAARSFWERPEVSAPPSLLGSQAFPERSRAPQVSSEPPVQVTIGRIEVTALTSPVPARRASQPRKPSLSLQDYLARRQDGKP